VRSTGRLRVVVLGMMGRSPFGGQTWLYLNWLLALHRAGHEVWYVEDDIVWFYDPEQNTMTDDCGYATRHVASVMDRIGLGDRWALRFSLRPGACFGRSPEQLTELYRTCDVLLNICGATELREDHLQAPFRVYLETDPVTAELRLAVGESLITEAFSAHHAFATYGENYGAPNCAVPLPDGISFVKTRQPVALDWWPSAFDPAAPCFTTIGNYRQRRRDLAYGGETYRWSKHHEWEKFSQLPSFTTQQFELALEAGRTDLAHLATCGWNVRSPLPMSLDIFGAYQDFIARSRGEFTVAKDMNIRLRSGWFSERDACYLASGKPVITQDTGFSSILPTGEGLFPVESPAEAVSAIDKINADYAHHCAAAREIAEEYFDARTIGVALLTDLGLA
jgi:hypothetical protein